MIEYQIVKDDTPGWRRMEKNRPKGVVYVYLTKYIIRKIRKKKICNANILNWV